MSGVRRIKLKVAYDGTDFRGSQYLPGVRTVEGELRRALSSLLRKDVELIGASRTDSGVHALGNVFIFDTDSSVPDEKFSLALDSFLPRDLRVVVSSGCAADFDPRKQKGIKTYEYSIYNARVEDPLLRRYAFFYSYEIDTDAVAEALGYMIGEHDFTSFSNPDSQVLKRGGDAVRHIFSASLILPRDDESGLGGGKGLIKLRIRGDGFLYNMVRIMVGTALEAGAGRRKPSDIEEILKKRDRRAAGMTAPANGLCLMGIDYSGVDLAVI